MNYKEARRKLIIAMGSRCAECQRKLDPSELIIHHKKFEQGKTLGFGSKERHELVWNYIKSGIIPKDVELLCDSCNRKRHKYRPSNEEIFKDRLELWDCITLTPAAVLCYHFNTLDIQTLLLLIMAVFNILGFIVLLFRAYIEWKALKK